MARDSFVFYRSFFEAIKRMPIEVQTEVYPALIEYALDGKEPKGLSDIAQGVFILVKPNIDASIARKENGKKFGKLGGRPPKKGKTASSADADELAKRLDAFHNHCKCENDGKPHSNFNDAKRHFCSWIRKAYAPVEHDSDAELPPPSYEFNGGFGGQDI